MEVVAVERRANPASRVISTFSLQRANAASGPSGLLGLTFRRLPQYKIRSGLPASLMNFTQRTGACFRHRDALSSTRTERQPAPYKRP